MSKTIDIDISHAPSKTFCVGMDVRGMLARCIQHEVDHLDGISIFDREREQQAIRGEAIKKQTGGRSAGTLLPTLAAMAIAGAMTPMRDLDPSEVKI